MRPDHEQGAAAGGTAKSHAAATPDVGWCLQSVGSPSYNLPGIRISHHLEESMGVKKTGKGRRKLGQKKRRMRARIRHRKG